MSDEDGHFKEWVEFKIHTRVSNEYRMLLQLEWFLISFMFSVNVWEITGYILELVMKTLLQSEILEVWVPLEIDTFDTVIGIVAVPATQQSLHPCWQLTRAVLLILMLVKILEAWRQKSILPIITYKSHSSSS